MSITARWNLNCWRHLISFTLLQNSSFPCLFEGIAPECSAVVVVSRQINSSVIITASLQLIREREKLWALLVSLYCDYLSYTIEYIIHSITALSVYMALDLFVLIKLSHWALIWRHIAPHLCPHYRIMRDSYTFLCLNERKKRKHYKNLYVNYT